MPPPFLQTKGVFIGAEGGGYYFWYGSCRSWLWTEIAMSSREELDTFYVHIPWTRFVDLVRIYMNINEHRYDKTCFQGFR